MPKKKKKGGAGGDDDGKSPSEAPAQATTPSNEKTSGPESSLLVGGGGSSILNKVSTAVRPLPPIMKLESTLNDTDPNAKLLGGSSDMAEMEQALSTHTESHASTGGSMNIFAINKDGISRAVVKFIDKPRPQPLTISFHFPGTFLTHKYVVAIVKGAITRIEGADVTSVQYCDRNVRLGTRGLENRWLVTLSDMRAKQLLMMTGIKVVNRTINVRSYDEVIGEEYREYQRWSDLQNRMKGFAPRKKLDPPGGATGASAAAAPTSPSSSVSTEAASADGAD